LNRPAAPVVNHPVWQRLILASATPTLSAMRTRIATALLVTTLATPALAQSYPVSGKWGEINGAQKGPIDCTDRRRVIDFNGNQRTDTNGGVPEYRNKSVQSIGQSDYRIVDEFSNGQVSAGQSEYTLRKIDSDRIVMNQSGTALNLQRCR
jgi:hypothetical protein